MSVIIPFLDWLAEQRGLVFDGTAARPSACKQVAHLSLCTKQKREILVEFKASRTVKMTDPARYNLASHALLSLPDLATATYEAGCILCDCCNCVLGRERDFLEQRSGIEEAYTKYNLEHNTNHRCIFLPKFHPELNFIERIWGRMKYYVRLHCDNKFDTMVSNINATMDSTNLPISMIRRYSCMLCCVVFCVVVLLLN